MIVRSLSAGIMAAACVLAGLAQANTSAYAASVTTELNSDGTPVCTIVLDQERLYPLAYAWANAQLAVLTQAKGSALEKDEEYAVFNAANKLLEMDEKYTGIPTARANALVAGTALTVMDNYEESLYQQYLSTDLPNTEAWALVKKAEQRPSDLGVHASKYALTGILTLKNIFIAKDYPIHIDKKLISATENLWSAYLTDYVNGLRGCVSHGGRFADLDAEQTKGELAVRENWLKQIIVATEDSSEEPTPSPQPVEDVRTTKGSSFIGSSFTS
ncbi:MAG: hypothetical protein Q3972_08225 [Corynebacterium sp.]|nr:hypothetical protein [Corynebacterium sp.]